MQQPVDEVEDVVLFDLGAIQPTVFGEASGLMALPGEVDIDSAASADIELYLQGKSLTGPERVKLFKLAFDASISGFSSRQALYEYFFFGDPVRMATALVNSYDRGPVRERIRDFLARTD